MTAGLQVWADNQQFVQIDSAYRNMRLTQSDTLQPGAFQPWIQGDAIWLKADVDVYGDYPIVAFRSNQNCFPIPTYVSPGHYIWTFVSQNPVAPVSYWVFNELLPNPSNFGFQVTRPSDGAVVFDANDKSAKLTDFWTYTGPELNVGQSVTHPMGGSWAVAPCQCSTVTLKAPTSQITMAYAMSTIGGTFRLSGNRVYIGALTNMGAQASAYTNPSYLFVDVAGY